MSIESTSSSAVGANKFLEFMFHRSLCRIKILVFPEINISKDYQRKLKIEN